MHHSKHRCEGCGYGISCAPKPASHRPRFIGDKSGTPDDELGRTFRCTRCNSYGGKVTRSTFVGDPYMGNSVGEYIVVSCMFCGFVEMFDARVVDQSPVGWKNTGNNFSDQKKDLR